MQISRLKGVELKMRERKNKKWCKLGRGIKAKMCQTKRCTNKALV